MCYNLKQKVKSSFLLAVVLYFKNKTSFASTKYKIKIYDIILKTI